METTYLNGWYLRTDGRIGPWTILPNQQPTSYQIWNAYKVKTYLENQGWSLSAICGTIGNMVHESTLSPAFIEETNRWRLPNSAANLTDVPNSVMQNFYRQYYGDPERGYVYECGGDGYIYEVYDSGIVRITVTVEGHIYLDSNRNVTGFSYSSCSAQFAVISGLSPSELDVGLNYINYSVSNNVVTARVHYSVTINGATNTGYINIVMSEF